jgi:hypothetical protein
MVTVWECINCSMKCSGNTIANLISPFFECTVDVCRCIQIILQIKILTCRDPLYQLVCVLIFDGSSTAILEFFTSFVRAKPKISICAMGMPKSMTRVSYHARYASIPSLQN